MFSDRPQYQKTLDDAIPEGMAEALEGKTVLVTGSTGLIGTVAVDALMRRGLCGKVIAGARTRETALKRFSEHLSKPGFAIAQYDIFKPFHLLEMCHYIIHLAANANPAVYKANPVQTLTGCVMGTDKLLDYCRRRKTARFVYVSSNEVYGRCDKSPISEDDIGEIDILDGRSCYPMGKRAAETLCACYASQYDVDYVVARSCHSYGPTLSETDNRAASQFINDAVNGKDIVLKSDGSAVRSYIYVSDCVRGIFTAMIKGEKGNAYNVAGDAYSVLELAKTVADKTGVNVIAGKSPEKGGAGYSAVSKNIVSRDKLEKLGWNIRYDLEKGIGATVDILKGKK